MRTLEFEINDFRLSKVESIDKMSKWSDDIVCSFKFSGEFWKRCKAVAVFEINRMEYAAPIHKDGICDIPKEISLFGNKFFRLKVVAKRDSEKIVTNQILVVKEE